MFNVINNLLLKYWTRVKLTSQTLLCMYIYKTLVMALRVRIFSDAACIVGAYG